MKPSKTLPEGLGLPPFPEVPDGYSHWEYLGPGGQHLRLNEDYAGCWFKGDHHWEPGPKLYFGNRTDGHYIRAVPLPDVSETDKDLKIETLELQLEARRLAVLELNAKICELQQEVAHLQSLGETENTVTPGFWGRMAAKTAQQRDEARVALTDLVLLCEGLAESGYVHKESQRPIEWSPDGSLARAKALLLR